MYRTMMMVAAAALVSSVALAQTPASPSAPGAGSAPGATTSPKPGGASGTMSNQSKAQQEQACRAMTSANERTRCLDNLNAAGPAGPGSNRTTTGSPPSGTNPAPGSSGSPAPGSSGSPGSSTGTTR